MPKVSEIRAVSADSRRFVNRRPEHAKNATSESSKCTQVQSKHLAADFEADLGPRTGRRKLETKGAGGRAKIVSCTRIPPFL